MHRHKRYVPLLLVSALLLVALWAAGLSAKAREGEGLFRLVEAADISELSPATLSAQIVEINWSQWASGQQEMLTLNLPDGETLIAQRVRLDHFDGGQVWVGRLTGRPESLVTLSVVGRTMAGTIRPDGLERYTLKRRADGKHVLYAVDPFLQREPPPAPPIVPPPEPESQTSQAAACPPEDGSRIDVLVAYTAAARAHLGGTTQIQAWINARISDMNTANADSGLPGLTIRLVRAQEVNYTESWSLDTDLNRLKATNDGYMDELHTARATYQADLVALIVFRADDACGLGYLYDGRPAEAFHPLAFSVTALRFEGTNDCSILTLSHEMGHNLGNHHDRANLGSPPVYPYYPYAYGYQSPHSSPPFRTIMAYSCSPLYDTCPRINRWSNPRTPYQSWPTGIDHDTTPASSADNARSMNDTRHVIANLVVNCEGVPTPTPTATTTPGTGDVSLLWGKVISGGGFSMGGEYAVVAAAGQPGAGSASGGEFALHAGALAAAPPPALTPTPTMTRTPTTTSAPPTATATRTPTRTTTPGALRKTFLPAIVKLHPRPATISGQVRHGGVVAYGVPLSLRFYDGSAWTTAATTTTNANGQYTFSNVPALRQNQQYYVRFGPNNSAPAWLWIWYGPDITTLSAGQSVAGGDFDIGNVNLHSPDTGTSSSLPVTFRWQTRGFASDTYRWYLYDPGSTAAWIQTNPTGGGQFILGGLPSGAQFGKEYRWLVYVYSGDNGYGISYYYRTISFRAGFAGVDTVAGNVQRPAPHDDAPDAR